MVVTITIPDDIYEVVQSEAVHFSMTPVERIERMVDTAHRFRIGKVQEQPELEWQQPRADAYHATLDHDNNDQASDSKPIENGVS